jgi:hypothetical protein
MTRRRPRKRRAIASAEPERAALQPDQLANAAPRQPDHRPEGGIVERPLLGGRLDLDDAAAPVSTKLASASARLSSA